ncbi:hypothetical protein JCM8547_000163 [Rhodosporidiobolus lusitaniae]
MHPSGAPYEPVSTPAGHPRRSSHLTRSRIAYGLAVLLGVVVAGSSRMFDYTLPSLPSSFLTSSDAPLPGPGCSSLALLFERNNASFWRAEYVARPRPALVVRPVEAERYLHCSALSLAFFAVRLHYGEGETHAVRSKPLQQSMGVYTFQNLPERLSSRFEGNVTAEVRLEFGYYPGGEVGQPCAGKTCEPGLLDRIVGMKWSGEEIFDSAGRRAVLPPGTSHSSTSPSTTCDTLRDLPAVLMHNETFAFLAPSGSPCTLLTPTPQPPAATPNPIRWLHLVGDSNTRHLVQHLSDPLGLYNRLSWTAPGEKYPTHFFCHDGSLSGVFVTFSWFFLTTDQDDAANLDKIDLSSLGAFLASIPWPNAPAFPASFNDVHIDHLYISPGSHAPLITHSGLSALLSSLRPALERKINSAKATSFVFTSSANPTTIPLNYGPQSTMRNNIMLATTNGIVADFVRSDLSTKADALDIFSLTNVIPPSFRVDSVHFQPQVYDAWAQVLWTAAELARERRGGADALTG